jgi:hypothetical protein
MPVQISVDRGSFRLSAVTQRDRTSARRFLLGVVALACLAAPAVAGAHLRSGTVAVDYSATVHRPETSAYSAQILQSDHAISLRLKRGHAVVLLGYLGEPVFRLDAAGLWLNAASPTAAGDHLLTARDRVFASAPRWRLRAGRHSLVWHDARAQGLPAGVSTGAWSVPLIVDGRNARLTGELQRYAAPLLWPWLALLAALLAAAALLLRAGREEPVHRATIGLAVASATASVVLALAFAFDSYASPGTWIESVDGIVFIAVGLGVFLGGPRQWHVVAAIGLGLLGIGIGLSKGALFLHPIALAILPATIMRWAAVAAIGSGCCAVGFGCRIYARTPGRLADDLAATAALRVLRESQTVDASSG